MSEETKTAKRPDFTAYYVPQREKAAWIEIGAAWAHQDGGGYSVKLDLIPQGTGRFVLRSRHSSDAGASEE